MIPSREAARKFGISHDYIGRLCKKGKAKGVLLAGSWYVNEDSLRGFLLDINKAKYERRETLREVRAAEYRESKGRLERDAELYASFRDDPEPEEKLTSESEAPMPVFRRPASPFAHGRSWITVMIPLLRNGFFATLVVFAMLTAFRFSDAGVFKIARAMLL